MQKGNINVTTENIFPIIKKFLYSDHEIFLRELISNAVDATQKLKTLASLEKFKGELGNLTINVKNYICTNIFFFNFLYAIFRASVTFPFYSLGAFLM